MSRRTMGIIFSNMHDESLGEMTQKRTMGSVLFGGRYRLVDFPLSAMSGAGIQHIGIVTRRNYQSLMDHVGSGRPWDLARKNGGLTVLPPFSHRDSGMYRGSLEALGGVMSYIRGVDAGDVAVCDCDIVANLDFERLLEVHREKGAGITVVYGRRRLEREGQHRGVVLEVGGDGFLQEVQLGNQTPGEHSLYLHTYIIDKELLVRLVSEAMARDRYSFHQDILRAQAARHNVYCYGFDGYFGSISSMESYYKISMDLLDPGVRREIFNPSRPVYTPVRDEVPCRYGVRASVKNSLLADGCVVEGTVEDSILFRGVRVLEGAVVRGCVVMQGAVVGRGASVSYGILDKDVYVQEGRTMAGYATYPLYIPKGTRV